MNDKKCEVEVFSRVTGFFRPVQSWNRGKVEEFKDRKKYNIELKRHDIENEDNRFAKSVAG